jgi:hypothetical protein
MSQRPEKRYKLTLANVKKVFGAKNAENRLKRLRAKHAKFIYVKEKPKKAAGKIHVLRKEKKHTVKRHNLRHDRGTYRLVILRVLSKSRRPLSMDELSKQGKFGDTCYDMTHALRRQGHIGRKKIDGRWHYFITGAGKKVLKSENVKAIYSKSATG